MKYQVFITAILLTLFSCNENKSVGNSADSEGPFFESIKIERYAVKNGNPDSISLSSYILESFDSDGKELKAVYYSTDNSIMMQFQNQYEGNNKTRINWVNAQDTLVRYVKNFYNDNDRLIRSESFSPQDDFEYGFIHNWKENGKVEEKGPIEEGKEFKPNAIYTYNDQAAFELLKEYDSNDSLYAVVKWNYTEVDEFDNWTERQMITNDTINQIEKRIIKYKKKDTSQ